MRLSRHCQQGHRKLFQHGNFIFALSKQILEKRQQKASLTFNERTISPSKCNQNQQIDVQYVLQ